MSSCSNALVICGTDTDVGKTVVSALVVQGLGATYWKPVQSGLEGGGDSGRLQALLQLPAERLLPEAYRLQTPVSPHWAAELEGITIDPARLALPAVAGALVVETAGGLLVPLRRDWLQIDQLAAWGPPVLAQLPPLEPLTASGLAAQWQAQDLGRTLTAAMGAAPNPH